MSEDSKVESEISKSEENQKNSGIEKIKLPDKICQKSCRVCSSNYLEEIHEMRNVGADFQTIINHLQEKYDYAISKSTLSTHFKNYRNIVATTSAKIMKEGILEESTELAKHTKAVISMIDKALELMQEKMNSGLYKPDIADLEKLFNIRHKILAGDSGSEKDLMVLFQKAQNEYGVDMTQGIALGLKFDD